MTDRSTTGATGAARPRRRHGLRLRQTVAVSMVAGGLVLGAFAAPSMAVEEGAAGTQTETEAANVQNLAPQANGLDNLPTPPGQDGGTPPGQGGEQPGEGTPPDEEPGNGCPGDLYTGNDTCDVIPVVCEEGSALNDVLGVCEVIPPVTGGEDGGEDEGTPPPPSKPEKPTKPGKPAKPGKGKGTKASPGASSPTGSIRGSSAGSLGSTLGVAEGSVPGAEGAAAVTSCSDSVICQSAPAATSTGPAVEGLPDTGAAENSRQLLFVGVGLLLAGGLLLKPGRRGRHRLVGA